MKSILTILAAICIVFSVSAQDMAYVATADATPEKSTEVQVLNRFQPLFPPSIGTFKQFLETELEYPELARDYSIEGTVVVEVGVSTTGEVSVIEVARSVSEPLDQAAVAAINKLPRFLPAMTNGKAVAKTMMIPFKFSLR